VRSTLELQQHPVARVEVQVVHVSGSQRIGNDAHAPNGLEEADFHDDSGDMDFMDDELSADAECDIASRVVYNDGAQDEDVSDDIVVHEE
jgi:hypothetical protein